MRSLSFALAIAATVFMAGCSSASQQLVGTWKGDIAPVGGSKNSLEGAFKGLLNAFVGPMTLEFNSDGKYKVSLAWGSQTGTYSVSGNEVTLTPDKEEDSKGKINVGKLVLSSDGKTLSSKKEFASDSVLELKKQADGPK